jgi:hypothetical protein
MPRRRERHEEAAGDHQGKAEKHYSLVAKAASNFSARQREGDAWREIKADEQSDIT